jgi:hypothetical protein
LVFICKLVLEICDLNECDRKEAVGNLAWIMKKLCLKTSGAEKQNSLPLPFEMDGWRKTICFV